jgi:hypothetical protein
VTSFLVLRAIGGCLRLCSRWSLHPFIFLNAHGMFWFAILCLSSYLHVMIAYEQEVSHVSPLEFVQGGCLKGSSWWRHDIKVQCGYSNRGGLDSPSWS